MSTSEPAATPMPTPTAPTAEGVADPRVADYLGRAQACRRYALELRAKADRVDERADDWDAFARSLKQRHNDGREG